jgi:glycosyltransferase involved in cell wall biosynthesis
MDRIGSSADSRLITHHEIRSICGGLAACLTIEGLAEALRMLVEQPVLCKQMGRAGRERVRAEFTADRMAERTLRIYEEVTQGSVA